MNLLALASPTAIVPASSCPRFHLGAQLDMKIELSDPESTFDSIVCRIASKSFNVRQSEIEKSQVHNIELMVSEAAGETKKFVEILSSYRKGDAGSGVIPSLG